MEGVLSLKHPLQLPFPSLPLPPSLLTLVPQAHSSVCPSLSRSWAVSEQSQSQPWAILYLSQLDGLGD